MAGLIVACVRTGTLYDFIYVERLRNMVKRHLAREYEMVCLTDQPERCWGVTFVDIKEVGLPGWWAKMLLFEPAWREQNKVIFLDLDTIVCNDMTPLADVPGEFAILESPVRLAGNMTYPCQYNSSVMVIGAGMASFMWTRFDREREDMMEYHHRYGDQACIEALYPTATLLNRVLPKGFFLNYRYLTNHKPDAAIINFGGAHRPHNCPIPWAMLEWV